MTELEAYQELVRKIPGYANLVVCETSFSPFNSEFYLGREIFEDFLSDISGIGARTIDDFQEKNKPDHQSFLELIQRLGLPQISRKDYLDYISSRSGWKHFYAAYPFCSGVLFLSKMGRSRAADEFLAYYSLHRGVLYSEQAFVWLTEKKADVTARVYVVAQT